MKKIAQRWIAILLSLVLMIQMIPVQALAIEIETGAMGTESSGSLKPEQEEAQIVAEVPSGRDEFQKEFILSNGLRMISIYGSAVHYEEDGEWKEIDNTLQPISATGAVLTGKAAQTSTVAYKNTAGLWDVKLPASLNSGSAVEVSKDGYTLSFQFAGEVHNNHMIMSVGDEAETANVEVPTVEPEAVAEADPSAESKTVVADNEAANEELTPELPTVSEEPSELPATAEQEATAPSEEGSDAVAESPAVNEPAEPAEEPTEKPSEELTEEPTSLPSNAVTENVDQIVGTTEADQTAATVTTQVNMTSAQVLDLSSLAVELPQQEYMDKLYSAVSYSNIYANTDLRYDLQSNQLKESVIIKQAKDTLAGYKYTLSAPGMVLELQEDNSVYAYAADAKDGDEPIFCMPAPFLVDDNRAYNDNIAVSLQQSGDTYTLTYSLPRTWLLEEERAYPVVLDPIVYAKSGIYTIRDQTVLSNKTLSHTWGCIAVGHSTTYKSIARALLKFINLPALTSADVIVDAQVTVQKCNSSSSAPMEVHAVRIPWDSSTVRWADMSLKDEEDGNWDPTVEDYQLVSSSGPYTWNVTNIVQQWYASGVNTGMLFCLPENLENSSSNTFREFYSSDWGGSRVPQLSITYLNNNGLEDYWDYTSQSAGRAGTGYVNNFTGNLVWVHNGLSFSGNRMPVSISHVYNANDKSNNNDYDYGLGYGWRTNYNQHVYQWTEDSSYYVWIDQDGTRRYFKYSSSGTYKNEIDNTLVLTTTGSGDEKYCITDKNGNKSYFDAEGRLKKICNNQQTVSSITVAYSGTSYRITRVTDGAGRVYAFNYNTNNLLSSIVFKGTGTTAISTLTYAYDSNSNLTSVTYPDGESVAYGYTTNHLLTSATDVDGYKVTYDYNVTSTKEPNRVVEIKEFDGTTEGGSLDIEYAHNQTTFVDHNGNKEIVQFNKFGSTVSIQDGLGRAQFAQYEGEDCGKSASQLTLSSKLQSTVVNLLADTEAAWVDGEDCDIIRNTIGFDDEEPYFACPTISFSSHVEGHFCVEVDASTRPAILPGRTYTFSCYMNTNSDSGFVYWRIGNNSIAIPLTQTPVANSNWVKISATYTHPDDATPSTANVILGQDDSGTTVFSDLQLVESTSSVRYNLVSNSDFRNGAIGWTKNSYCTTDDTIYVPDQNDEDTPADLFVSAAPQLDTSYYQIVGSATAAKTVSQTVTISGSKDDVFTLAGWAKGDSVPLSDSRKFGIAVTFIDSDGVAGEEHLLSFNPDSDSENNWQYAATKVIADKNYTSIRVDLLYCNNQNTAYFDGIQLYKEEFGQSYVYDEETGLVKSVIDLQQQETNYEYADNQLTGVFEYLGENKKYIAKYEYDAYNNVTKAIAEDGTVTQFTYDTYGNNTAVSLSSDGTNQTISSSATYTANGNLLSTVKDSLGKVTTYGYDAQTGVLEWVQAPGEDESTRTVYEYDEDLFRTEGVSKRDASVSYSYNTDLLSTITSASGTVYNFTYGDFDLVQSVGIGNRTLISHEYSASPNFYLTKSTYGNGDTISYAYDGYGRTVSKAYEDGDMVSYTYDNNGNLGLVTDSASGRTTKYLYDFQDRLSRYEETGAGYSSSVEWGYDTDNNLTAQTHVLNGTEYLTEYTYNEDNQLTFVTMEDHAMRYDYDALGRLTTIRGVTSEGGTVDEPDSVEPFCPNISIQYTEPSTGTTSTQISGWIICDNYGFEQDGYYYTYDDQGNITDIEASGGTYAIRYTYDELGQLTYEHYTDYSIVYDQSYTYDDGGNILTKTVHPLEMYSLNDSSAYGTTTYTYGDATWKDLLTAINGQPLTYDGIGNLTNDGTWTYTWEHGRQLASMTSDDTEISYAYNADGLRISKTVDGAVYQYHYVGDQLAGMTWGNNEMYFYYDALGPAALNYNGDFYYYIRNTQGDIIYIADEDYSFVVSYVYDAWGNLLVINDYTDEGIGTLNPLRYRGYVYDTETGLYYLQSRYYNPSWGRFINTDIFPSTGQGINCGNLFAYCENNPINRQDSSGYIWETVWDIASLVGSAADVAANPANPWAWASLIGDVIDVVLPCVGGLGEAVDAAKAVYRVVDKGDDIIDSAKQMRRTADALEDVKTSTGAYVILYEKGSHYIGKGGFQRAIDSAKEHLTSADRVSAIIWAPTSSTKSAFVTEYLLQSTLGLHKTLKESYNIIWSPGKKIFRALQ